MDCLHFVFLFICFSSVKGYCQFSNSMFGNWSIEDDKALGTMHIEDHRMDITFAGSNYNFDCDKTDYLGTYLLRSFNGMLCLYFTPMDGYGSSSLLMVRLTLQQSLSDENFFTPQDIQTGTMDNMCNSYNDGRMLIIRFIGFK